MADSTVCWLRLFNWLANSVHSSNSKNCTLYITKSVHVTKIYKCREIQIEML